MSEVEVRGTLVALSLAMAGYSAWCGPSKLCSISSDEHVSGLPKELAATKADPGLAAQAVFAMRPSGRKIEVIESH